MLQCGVLAQHDTAGRHKKISSARSLIYEQQYVVDTPQVEALLKPESLVPTVVCFTKLYGVRKSRYIYRMPFQRDLVQQASTFSLCSLLICCTSLSLGFGKLF